MTTVAVMFAPGCEEVEGLTVVDVLRRMGIETKMVGLEGLPVPGAHKIELTCDEQLGPQLMNYDVVAFPGGRGGAEKLRDSKELCRLMVQRQQAGQWNAAMCAAPIAFARYGLLEHHDYTCFPGFEQVIQQEVPSAHFHEEMTVVDPEGHIITSRGPATALAYAYRIAEVLGYDTTEIKRTMLWDYLKDNI